MKKLFAIVAVAGFLTACNDTNTNQTTTDTAASTNTQVDSFNARKDSGTTGTNLDTATTKPAGVTADTSTIR